MRMSVLLLLLVGFDAATQELHEVFDVEVVSARRHERFPVAALQYVVGLGVDAVGFQRIVGVDPAPADRTKRGLPFRGSLRSRGP